MEVKGLIAGWADSRARPPGSCEGRLSTACYCPQGYKSLSHFPLGSVLVLVFSSRLPCDVVRVLALWKAKFTATGRSPAWELFIFFLWMLTLNSIFIHPCINELVSYVSVWVYRIRPRNKDTYEKDHSDPLWWGAWLIGSPRPHPSGSASTSVVRPHFSPARGWTQWHPTKALAYVAWDFSAEWLWLMDSPSTWSELSYAALQTQNLPSQPSFLPLSSPGAGLHFHPETPCLLLLLLFIQQRHLSPEVYCTFEPVWTFASLGRFKLRGHPRRTGEERQGRKESWWGVLTQLPLWATRGSALPRTFWETMHFTSEFHHQGARHLE